MTDDGEFALFAIWVIIFLGAFFMCGWMFGREHQCETLGMEIYKGKCVTVTRQETKQ